MNKTLTVIVGPTASGKTSFAINLAKKLGCEILSADSRQFYQEIKIGTAAPSKEQLEEVPHHFIGNKSIKDLYTVGDYERGAMSTLKRLYETSNHAILVGGSGLYIKAVCEGLDEFPPVNPIIRNQIRDLYKEEGLVSLQNLLKLKDPEYYKEVDLRNPQRLQRALEVCLSTNKKFSSFRTGVAKKRPFKIKYIGLEPKREILYDQIEARVEHMVAKGLETEVRSSYPYRHHNALQTVGYNEFFDYLDGFNTHEETIEKIKHNTKAFAKRQLTWFKKVQPTLWMEEPDIEKAVSYSNLK